MKGVRVIWKSHSSEITKGYLRLSVRDSELGKTKVVSLNLPPISERHFDKVKQRVKSSFKDFEKYNVVIEKVLKEYEIRKTPDFIKEEKKTLNFFVENMLIPNCKSQGTTEKYRNILNLLTLFHKEKYNINEILMKSITIEFINEWKVWLRVKRNLTENTISYKTKTFSSFISKSINDGYYTYFTNPFKSIKNVITEKHIEFLTEMEIERLINTKLYEINRNDKSLGKNKELNPKRKTNNTFSINEVRLWFLFQLFQHGIRVSDLSTLRWSNFYFDDNELRISKRMIKTKHILTTMVYYPGMYILLNYIPQEILSEKEKEEIDNFKMLNDKVVRDQKTDKSEKIEVKFRNIFDFDFEKIGDDLYLISEECIENQVIYITTLLKNPTPKFDIVSLLKHREYDIDLDTDDKIKNDERLVQLNKIEEYIKIEKINRLKSINQIIETNNNNIYKLTINIILRLKNHKDYSNRFVFPILKDKDFSNILKEEDFDKMDKKQYSKFVGRRSYYNRILRYVGNQCDITNLTTHKSRHSYTSLIIKYNEDINLYDLMKSLGHKNLSTTQGYIQNFVNKRVDTIGKGFSDMFNVSLSPNKLKI
jgi:integrase